MQRGQSLRKRRGKGGRTCIRVRGACACVVKFTLRMHAKAHGGALASCVGAWGKEDGDVGERRGRVRELGELLPPNGAR